MAENKIINSLYDYLKNTSKKLKIICGWDEVIQPCEPYALYEAEEAGYEDGYDQRDFPTYFRDFWKDKELFIEYSSFSSHLKEGATAFPIVREKQIQIKNSPNFYQEAPFLTIAEDLLKLIKEDKVEKLIFLSAYDKRKFPNLLGDMRKPNIFKETFKNLDNKVEFEFQMLGFDSKLLEQADFHQTLDNKTKGKWIRENMPDVDVVIDDNPKILKEMLNTTRLCKECYKIMVGNNAPSELPKCKTGKCVKIKATMIAPYYPVIPNQHHPEVLLVNQEVSKN